MKHLITSVFFSACMVASSAIFAQGILSSDPMRLPDGLEQTYSRGLAFLKKTQSADGSWSSGSYGNQPGVVGLCVMAFLSHGDDPETGPYSDNIKRALNFIVKNQNQQNGYIGNSMYNHGFATLALAEAYGVVQDDRLGPALEKAVALIISSQKRNRFGGWRYTPDSNDADTTVSGACMVALFAASNAGIKVPDDSIRKGLEYYKSCQSDDGGIGYTNMGGPNNIRTSIAGLVWTLAKEKKSNQYIKAMSYLENSGIDNIESHYLHYGLYYMSQTFFHSDSVRWERWNAENIKFLQKLQSEDGSWDGGMGRDFSTASALLSLALNYRYLPIYER